MAEKGKQPVGGSRGEGTCGSIDGAATGAGPAPGASAGQADAKDSGDSAPRGVCTPNPAHVSATEPEYASYVFLLGADGVHPLAHELYVALARGQASCADLAGKSYRLADWHVRFENGRPAEIVREWYGWVHFDGGGCFDPASTRAMYSNAGTAALGADVDTSSFPAPAEIEAMRAHVFTPAAG